MKPNLDGPADTSMMGIVHDALRRDLARTRAALTDGPAPDATRRAALAGHLTWMAEFLDRHHAAEDDGLYPMVRAAVPATAAVRIDAMNADHHAIHPALENLPAAGRRWERTGTDTDRAALVDALDALTDVLLPHLDREETEAMPLVSRTITHRQWQEWDQTYNIKTKSLPMLAKEGNWLIDGLDEARRQVVLHLVPLVPRLIVLYGFGPRYRRDAAIRWGTPSVPAVR